MQSIASLSLLCESLSLDCRYFGITSPEKLEKVTASATGTSLDWHKDWNTPYGLKILLKFCAQASATLYCTFGA